MVAQEEIDWVLLNYRVPREPSTPRIAIWRRIKDLGAVQVGDGLVALPDGDQTREQLEWVAAQVDEAGGDAIVWSARPTSKIDSARLIAEHRAARDDEYGALLAAIETAGRPVDSRTIAKWRRELRRIGRRDHFDATGRDAAQGALTAIVGTDLAEEPAR